MLSRGVRLRHPRPSKRGACLFGGTIAVGHGGGPTRVSRLSPLPFCALALSSGLGWPLPPQDTAQWGQRRGWKENRVSEGGFAARSGHGGQLLPQPSWPPALRAPLWLLSSPPLLLVSNPSLMCIIGFVGGKKACLALRMWIQICPQGQECKWEEGVQLLEDLPFQENDPLLYKEGDQSLG